VREKWNESESKTVVKLDEIKLKLDKLEKMLGVQKESARGNCIISYYLKSERFEIKAQQYVERVSAVRRWY
jgi:hypothetical protein